MNIAEKILARGEDDAIAVLHGEQVLNYRDLRRNVTDVAQGLLARGHAKGDRIGLWSENSAFFVTAYLGILRAGLVAVPLQAELTEQSFAQIAGNADIKDVLVSKRFSHRLQSWTGRVGVTPLVESRWPGAQDESAARFPEIDPIRDLAALMFTSGSTGAPRGVMVSHRNIECNTSDIVAYMELTPADRVMVVLPFHYCFGLSLLHTHLMAGGSVVLNNEFMYPENVVQDMLQKGCTGLAGVPSTYQILLRKSRFQELVFPKLRWLQQAGGKLPNSQISEIVAAFPQVRFFLMYGQTEATARLSYLPPERLHDKLGSIGRGLPSTRLDVVKPDGSRVVPASDEQGEIVATGENIALGYWKDPDETSVYFRNGRLHTGDIARVDADGFIFIEDRARDLIKSGGNRVCSKEVEDLIAEMPEVVEVAVLGMPHGLLGEAIHAFVVVKPEARIKPEDVENHCRKRVPPFKTPETVTFVKNMPHNEAGKILKAKLREMATWSLAQ